MRTALIRISIVTRDSRFVRKFLDSPRSPAPSESRAGSREPSPSACRRGRYRPKRHPPPPQSIPFHSTRLDSTPLHSARLRSFAPQPQSSSSPVCRVVDECLPFSCAVSRSFLFLRQVLWCFFFFALRGSVAVLVRIFAFLCFASL